MKFQFWLTCKSVKSAIHSRKISTHMYLVVFYVIGVSLFTMLRVKWIVMFTVDTNHYFFTKKKKWYTPDLKIHFTEIRKHIKFSQPYLLSLASAKKLNTQKEQRKMKRENSEYWMTVKWKMWKIRKSHVEKYSENIACKLLVSDKVMTSSNSPHEHQENHHHYSSLTTALFYNNIF